MSIFLTGGHLFVVRSGKQIIWVKTENDCILNYLDWISLEITPIYETLNLQNKLNVFTINWIENQIELNGDIGWARLTETAYLLIRENITL